MKFWKLLHQSIWHLCTPSITGHFNRNTPGAFKSCNYPNHMVVFYTESCENQKTAVLQTETSCWWERSEVRLVQADRKSMVTPITAFYKLCWAEKYLKMHKLQADEGQHQVLLVSAKNRNLRLMEKDQTWFIFNWIQIKLDWRDDDKMSFAWCTKGFHPNVTQISLLCFISRCCAEGSEEKQQDNVIEEASWNTHTRYFLQKQSEHIFSPSISCPLSHTRLLLCVEVKCVSDLACWSSTWTDVHVKTLKCVLKYLWSLKKTHTHICIKVHAVFVCFFSHPKPVAYFNKFFCKDDRTVW